MKRTKTKSALITSALAMLICVALLVGTTFAWFTDTASTGVNRIQAGNLKVDLLMHNGNDYVSIKNTNFTDLFSFGATEAEKLWEPGKTKLAYLAVENKGNLALKYNIILNISDQGLADALEYAVIDGAMSTDTFNSWDDVKTATAQVGAVPKGTVTAAPNGRLLAEEADYFVLAVHMKEEAGNEYQGKSCDIDIAVVATQAMYESDSLGNEYDMDAAFPAIGVGRAPINSPVAVNAGIISVTVPAVLNTKGLDYKLVVEVASVDPTITIDTNQASENLDITLIDGDGNKVTATGTEKVAVSVRYKPGLGEVKVYHKGVEITGVNYDSATGVITFETDSFSPYTIVYAKPMWANHTAAALTVNNETKTITIATAEELALFAKNINEGTSYGGYTVKLTADIDLGNKIWTPINMKNGEANNLTFDGNGHTIKGLYVADYKDGSFGNTVYSGLFKQFGGTIKDLTMKNSVVIGQRSAVLIGATNKNVTLNNVKILDSVIRSEQKNGGLIGYLRSTGNVGTSTVNITGCTVENLTFRSYDDKETDAPWQCGAIWGYSDVETIANVTGNVVDKIKIINDPNIGYNNGENAQLASHAFIGSITNFYNTDAERSEENYNKFAITIKNNTIGSSSGFAIGNYASEFCGAFYKTYSSTSRPYRFVTKVVYNGAVRTINPFANVHEVASQKELEAVAEKIKPYEIVSITKDFTINKQIKFTTNNIVFDGNGHTITGDRAVVVGNTLIRFGEDGKWCQNILVRNINFNGKGGRAFHFHGGDMSVLDNVTINGEFSLAVNFYGTHGAVLNNCNFKSTAAEKHASSTVFANQQSANQLILNNTKIDDIYVNVSNNDASTLPNNGIKVVVNSGSTIDRLYLPETATLVPYKVNGGNIASIGRIE